MKHYLSGLSIVFLAAISSADALDVQATKVPGRAPPSLSDGEIATNRADGRLFYKSETGAIVGGLLPDLDAGGYLKFRNGMTLGRRVGNNLDTSTNLIAPPDGLLRSLADRLTDKPDARDFGAEPVAADIGAALTTALAKAPSTAASGNTAVAVKLDRSGFYAINSPWTYPATRPVVLEAGWGVNWSGSLGFPGLKYDVYHGHHKTNRADTPLTDTSHWYDYGRTGWLTDAGWEQTTVRESHVLKWATGASDPQAYTQVARGVYTLVPDLSLTLPSAEDGTKFFEKDALAGHARTEAGFAAQVVGVRGRCDIGTPAINAAGNPSHGICWGGNFYHRINPGSDGYSIGIEVNTENFGSEVKQIGGYDKIGLKFVPKPGSKNVTAGIYGQADGAAYYTAFWWDTNALVADPASRLIKLPGAFEVMRDGSLLVGKGTPNATARGTGIEASPNGSLSLTNYGGNVRLSLDGQANSQRGVDWRSAGSLRWDFATDFNGTSDLVLNAFDDAGRYSSTPLKIERGTGRTVVKGAKVTGVLELPSYAFANLPGSSAGSQAYCTDCREPGQVPGAGTGMMVFRNASGWRSTAGGAAAH